MEKKAKSCPTSKAKSSSACIKKQIVRNHQVPLRETAVKTVNLDLNLPENSPNIPADVSSARSNPEHQSQSGKTICSTQNRIRKSKEKENSDKAQVFGKFINFMWFFLTYVQKINFLLVTIRVSYRYFLLLFT